jgi:hypothetical protein
MSSGVSARGLKLKSNFFVLALYSLVERLLTCLGCHSEGKSKVDILMGLGLCC